MLKTLLKSFVITLTLSQTAFANLASDIHDLQVGWAKANYELVDDAQINAFEILIKQAEAITKLYPNSAESWIWQGIIQSTYAGKASAFSALSYAEAAKASLEKSIEINANALNGSAYTSLGTLYFKVPGWPLGFGDDVKANNLLKKAVELNPNGIDANYFYADFLIEEEKYNEAKKYLLQAKNAPARPDRPLADKYRQLEITSLLKKLDEDQKYYMTEANDDI